MEAGPPSKKQRCEEVEHNPLSLETIVQEFLASVPDDQGPDKLDELVEQHGVEKLEAWRRPHKHEHTLMHELVWKPGTLAHAAKRHGFNLNPQRLSDQCTPMHLAVWSKQEGAVNLLRELGADPNLKNKYGETVTELIRVRNSLNNLLWIDLELASLTNPIILECALIVTDSDLHELARANWVIGMTPEMVEKELWGGTAADFHRKHSEKNGLVEEMLGSTTSHEQMKRELMDLVKLHCPQPKSCPLAGSSVHCDRDVLKNQVPELYEHASHQVIDVSTFLSVMRRWTPAKLQELNKSEIGGNHRAMSDIESSLSTLKYIRENVLIPEQH
eukprot:TRINITY_DN3283_c0_g1_i2.p1 TRINITY_DN3283_c0_g1~~TRINITY_DN3283_c0_g1_i2.p1  ORF type:complete len:330 (-),score=87.57 TRINITY_DN3283_c0_g1_i2:220-1209(-)